MATLIAVAIPAVCANIWEVPPFAYYAARWAIVLWAILIDAMLWVGVYWTYH